MTQTQQPEALRLAHALSGGKLIDDSTEWADTLHAAAAELRHQHARIEELEAQLAAIGAGDVEPLRKRAAAPQAVQAEVPEAIEQMAVDRYKVVPSHESMFHRWAVVAGNGIQQLYIGREGECQSMARKFMGAFLDGAFVAMQNAAPRAPRRGSAWQTIGQHPKRNCRCHPHLHHLIFTPDEHGTCKLKSIMDTPLKTLKGSELIAYTDYPIPELGDKFYTKAPMREC